MLYAITQNYREENVVVIEKKKNIWINGNKKETRQNNRKLCAPIYIVDKYYSAEPNNKLEESRRNMLHAQYLW